MGESIISKLPYIYITDKQGIHRAFYYCRETNTPELATSSGFWKVFWKGILLEWILWNIIQSHWGMRHTNWLSENEEDFISTTTTDVELPKGVGTLLKYDITEVLTSSEGEAMAQK